MLALTLYPWWVPPIAYLPDAVAKRCENRSWRPNTQFLRGERIAIHAGALPFPRHSGPTGRKNLYDALVYGPVQVAWPKLNVLYQISEDAAFDGWQLVYGEKSLPLHERSIVCTARVMDWDRRVFSQWDEDGAWHWRLADVITLPRPVPVERGHQRFWRLPQDVELAVLAGQREALCA